MSCALPSLDNLRIGIIGLGYVGLPLAVEFAKHFSVIGFDLKAQRIAQLQQGYDYTLELSTQALTAATQITYTTDAQQLAACQVYIVTVPTPIDQHKRPQLTPLIEACETVGKLLAPGNVVIYESTVYPGATEEVCVPILEQYSALTHNLDFFTGYSPERINPGDPEHRLPNITKITAGSNSQAADFVDALYSTIIMAGTHRASSIRIAEAAKVIENTQRDLNIALINELAILFNKLGLDTAQVLAAAGTKWNFLPFRPGLVGGHCIGVDPYYLTHKAQAVGHHPEIILAGRRINDYIGEYIVSQVIKLMIKKEIHFSGAKVLVLGLTFKENCPDLRNTRVIDIILGLEQYGLQVAMYDPWADPNEVSAAFNHELLLEPQDAAYDAIILAVAHRQFCELTLSQIHAWCKPNSVIYDVKSVWPLQVVDGRL